MFLSLSKPVDNIVEVARPSGAYSTSIGNVSNNPHFVICLLSRSQLLNEPSHCAIGIDVAYIEEAAKGKVVSALLK